MKNLEKFLSILDGEVDGLLHLPLQPPLRRGIRHCRGYGGGQQKGLPVLYGQPLY